MVHLALLALLWIAWCTLHSLLIARRVQEFFRRRLGRFAPAYRLLYVLVSIATLAPVVWYQEALPQRLILPRTLSLTLLQAALLVYGLLIFFLGGRAYDLHAFLGIRQWQHRMDAPQPALAFHSDGILARVRHPWYSGGIALVWGLGAVTDVFLLSRALLTAYLLIGTLLEEQRLAAELGEKYRVYQRQVPMLIPQLTLKKRKNQEAGTGGEN
jgi:protein-S-isoprenylcysteine O-methyltransferase Ste14